MSTKKTATELAEEIKDELYSFEGTCISAGHPLGSAQNVMRERQSLESLVDQLAALSHPAAEPAEPSALPSVPTAIINAITAYGDARADGDVNRGVLVFTDIIQMLRRELALTPSEPHSDACGSREGRFSTYETNILNGVADWLDSRSGTSWATTFCHAGLMQTWAKDLRDMLAASPPVPEREQAEPEVLVGLTVADVLRIFDANSERQDVEAALRANLPPTSQPEQPEAVPSTQKCCGNGDNCDAYGMGLCSGDKA